jgi:hypothetical protein
MIEPAKGDIKIARLRVPNMGWLKTIRLAWLVLSLLIFVTAQLMFSGQQSSEVAGNLVFIMLVLCLPVSMIGYIAMILVMYAFEPYGLFAYNNRIVLTAVWSVYFVCGLVQWYLIPLVWSRRKAEKLLQSQKL